MLCDYGLEAFVPCQFTWSPTTKLYLDIGIVGTTIMLFYSSFILQKSYVGQSGVDSTWDYLISQEHLLSSLMIDSIEHFLEKIVLLYWAATIKAHNSMVRKHKGPYF